ncbi:hypothetical protein L1887_53242 [Cichorium endivia]|nr:hypothetical protein L1887_53242 [Cichorium endivia]
MIGRADIEGSKSNVAMNAWLPQASYPCDVPPQPNSPPDNVFRPDRPAEAGLGSKKRGIAPLPIHGISPRRSRSQSVPRPARGDPLSPRKQLESPPTADGFGTGTPVPSPQSQSFSEVTDPFLPTSLAYIVPSTRGCSPWRPDAVMSTTGRGRHSVLRIFKGPPGGAPDTAATCGALPAAGPYLRLSRFQGGAGCCKSEKITLPEAPADVSGLPNVAVSAQFGTVTPASGSSRIASSAYQKLAQLGALDSVARTSTKQPRHERFARQYRCGPPPEYPLASPRSGIVHHLSGPDRHAHTRTLLRRSKVGRRCTPLGGSRSISFLAPCGFTHPLTRTHVRLLGPCFKTGRMGCPQAGAGSTQVYRRDGACCQPDRRDGISTSLSTARALAAAPIRTGPRPESIGRTGYRRSTSDRDASPGAPIRFPPDNFKHSLTLFSKSFSSFPRGYLFAIWSHAAPRGATGSGHDGALTLSGAPFQGTWARSAAEDASPDYNSDSEAVRFSSWADPGFDNDPSAGSPTETLLRLLLPLNDKVQWNSRDVAGGEAAHACFEHSNFFKVTAPEARRRPVKARSASPTDDRRDE